MIELYDEAKDAWHKFTWEKLYSMASCPDVNGNDDEGLKPDDGWILTKLPFKSSLNRNSGAAEDQYKTKNFWISTESFEKLRELGDDEYKGKYKEQFQYYEKKPNRGSLPFGQNLCKYLQGNTDYMDPALVDFFEEMGFTEMGVIETLIRQMLGGSNHTKEIPDAKWELVIVRPNIEHSMLGVIMGRGGVDDLGATLWGQTELSVYDDSKHGIWGM